jgi:cytochrome P450
MMNASTPEFERILTDEQCLADPYPGLQRLQEEAPVYWSDSVGGWVVSRYEDVLVTFKNTAHFSNEGRLGKATNYLPPERRSLYKAFEEHFAHKSLLHSDPPDHTRMRSLIARELNAKVIEDMKPQIQAAVDGLIDDVIDQGSMDVASDLASPLPIRIIAQILGVPASDYHYFRTWADDLLSFQGVNKPGEEALARANRAVQSIRPYVRNLMDERRESPRNDLVSFFVAAEAEGGKITEEELLCTCVTLFVAGQETTLSFIANSIWCFLSNPDQLARIRLDESLLTSALEESLRCESPVSRQPRLIKEDFEMKGFRFKKGEMVFQMVNAANRDPSVFPDPQVFDAGRQPNRHIAFGHGIHFCVGALLARAEAAIAVGTALRRLPNLQLVEARPDWDIEKRNSRVLRTLKVRF